MITKGEKNNVKYQVKYVKREQINGKTVTKFAIRDPIKGLRDEWVTYWLTVFDDIELEDGDFVRLLDFDNLVSSYYPAKKKITHFMSAVVEIIKRDDRGERDPSAEQFENPFA